MSRKLFPSSISTKEYYRMNYSIWISYNLFLFRLRFPDFRPLPYHPIGFNVEVAFGVVGVDERDSLFESSSFLSLRDLLDFFFFLHFPFDARKVEEEARELSGIIKRSLVSALGHLVVHLASRIRINYILKGYLSSAA